MLLLSVDPAAHRPLPRKINYYPPSGRELKRTYAMTELSSPDAETIVLGPLPPPTLPPHVRTSTLPPGHPPQSYGAGYTIPSASSRNSDSSNTLGIAEEAASKSQPAVSTEGSDSRENLKKRRRRHRAKTG